PRRRTVRVCGREVDTQEGEACRATIALSPTNNRPAGPQFDTGQSFPNGTVFGCSIHTGGFQGTSHSGGGRNEIVAELCCATPDGLDDAGLVSLFVSILPDVDVRFTFLEHEVDKLRQFVSGRCDGFRGSLTDFDPPKECPECGLCPFQALSSHSESGGSSIV